MKNIFFTVLVLVVLITFNACKHNTSKDNRSGDNNPSDTTGWGAMHIKLAEEDDGTIMQFRQLEGQYLRRTYLIANLVKVLRANGSFSDKSKLDDLDSAKESAVRFYINENHLDSASLSQYRLTQ